MQATPFFFIRFSRWRRWAPIATAFRGRLIYLRAALAEYWPFVVFAFAAQAGVFWRAYKGENTITMMSPYKAVIKNHLVIIGLGFLTILLPGANILWVLLLVYFFPWEIVFARLKGS